MTRDILNPTRIRSVLLALDKGTKRLSKKNGWTKNVFARNKNGDSVYHRSTSAVSFCAIGAIAEHTDAEQELEWTLRNDYPGLRRHRNSVADFNDSRRSKEPVLRLYKLTKSRLKRELRELEKSRL